MLFILSAQFLHNNLVKFCCARLNIFKLCVLKTLILKGLNRYDIPVALCPLKRDISLIFVRKYKTLQGFDTISKSC